MKYVFFSLLQNMSYICYYYIMQEILKLNLFHNSKKYKLKINIKKS